MLISGTVAMTAGVSDLNENILWPIPYPRELCNQ